MGLFELGDGTDSECSANSKRKIRVLLIGDDVADLERVTRILVRCGEFDIRREHSLANVMSIISHDIADVVLLDLFLGDLSCMSLVPALCRATSAPIIILSGGGKDVRQNAIDNGAAAVVSKSNDLESRLINEIRSVLGCFM